MDKKPLKIAVYGMDQRSVKTMQLFLKGPCHGEAVIVAPEQADCELIDIDHPQAKDFYDQCLEKHPERTLLALSLEKVALEHTLSLTKPVSRDQFLHVLSDLKAAFPQLKQSIPEAETSRAPQNTEQTSSIPEQPEQPPLKQEADPKHEPDHSAAQHNQAAFIGILNDIDFSDQQQLASAYYQAQDYLLGYLKAVINHAKSSGDVMQMSTSWKTIIIYPQHGLINLEANDKQLRAFAGIPLHQINNNLSFKAIGRPEPDLNDENNQTIEAFIWKLVIWTSRGRYPYKLALDAPVYLKHWPNFTRLLITPHALRIAALLMQGPRSVLELARQLDISPQYVFVFASTCYESGLLAPARRQSDTLIQPVPPPIKRHKGLFKKILNKLHIPVPGESDTHEST